MQPTKRSALHLRPQRPAASRQRTHRLAVFTAMDGAMLDARTFGVLESKPLVDRLSAAEIPVVPVSGMTLDEVAPIASELGLKHAMIIEAGGAIARWSGGGWDVEACGPPVDALLDVISEIEERSGADLLVYSALPEREAARISGRSGEMLLASTRRSFSEPFVLERGSLEAVKRAAASIGFSVREGHRFLHLCRECGLGEAFTRVRDELQCEIAVAIGTSAVDAEFLTRADIPIIVPGPDGTVDAELRSSVPGAVVAASPGPAGWSAALENVWQSCGGSKRRSAVNSSRSPARSGTEARGRAALRPER